MVKSVIFLLFSYQTGYIMWHSRLRIYIPLRLVYSSHVLYLGFTQVIWTHGIAVWQIRYKGFRQVIRAHITSLCFIFPEPNNITDLVCYTYFHWFFNPECQHIFGKQTGYIFQSPKTIKTWTTKHYASLNQWYNME
jgi:hypothetical protein